MFANASRIGRGPTEVEQRMAMGGVLEDIAASYDREARWHDERDVLQDILTN